MSCDENTILTFFTISYNSSSTTSEEALGVSAFFPFERPEATQSANTRKASEFLPQLWIIFELDEAGERRVETNYLQHPNLKMIIRNSHLSA